MSFLKDHNFKLKPRLAPLVSDLVQHCNWNVAKSTLELVLKEDQGFSAFAWFGTINKRYAEAQESSFVDLDKDTIQLDVLGDKGVVATLLFRNLKVIDHACSFQSESTTENDLKHIVVLHYNSVHISIEELDKIDGVDTEWKSE